MTFQLGNTVEKILGENDGEWAPVGAIGTIDNIDHIDVLTYRVKWDGDHVDEWCGEYELKLIASDEDTADADSQTKVFGPEILAGSSPDLGAPYTGKEFRLTGTDDVYAAVAEIAKFKGNTLALGGKETNPKDALAGKKPRWFSFIPLRVLIGVGMAMFEGGRKYGRHNFRPAGVLASVYVDACVSGHLTPWMEGEDIDPDSGLNHIDKAIASLVVLRDSIYEGNLVDDRPPRGNIGPILKDAEEKWAAIQARHPTPMEPWTQKRIDAQNGDNEDRP